MTFLYAIPGCSLGLAHYPPLALRGDCVGSNPLSTRTRIYQIGVKVVSFAGGTDDRVRLWQVQS